MQLAAEQRLDGTAYGEKRAEARSNNESTAVADDNFRMPAMEAALLQRGVYVAGRAWQSAAGAYEGRGGSAVCYGH